MKKTILVALFALATAPQIVLAQNSDQLELPGLFDNRISEADLRTLIAGQMAPLDTQFRDGAKAVNPNITEAELRRLEADRFLQKGGVSILEGAALEAGIKDTFFYNSPFDRMQWSKLYSSIDLRFELSATNEGSRRGYSSLTLNSFDLAEVPAEDAKARALGLAEAVISSLKSQGVQQTQVTYAELDISRDASLQRCRVDIVFISDAKTPAQAATLMNGVIDQFPKSSILAKVGDSNRVKRALKGINLFEKAEVDAKKAARSAGKK